MRTLKDEFRDRGIGKFLAGINLQYLEGKSIALIHHEVVKVHALPAVGIGKGNIGEGFAIKIETRFFHAGINLEHRQGLDDAAGHVESIEWRIPKIGGKFFRKLELEFRADGNVGIDPARRSIVVVQLIDRLGTFTGNNCKGLPWKRAFHRAPAHEFLNHGLTDLRLEDGQCLCVQ